MTTDRSPKCSASCCVLLASSRSFVATAVVEIFISFLFNLVPVLGSLFGFIVGLLAAILVIKTVFGTSFRKAFLVWIFNIVAAGIGLLLAAMLMASSLLMSHGI